MMRKFFLSFLVVWIFLVALARSAQKRPLRSLSVDEVVILFKQLNLPDECEAVARNAKIDGRVLRELNSVDDIKSLKLPLLNITAQVLLSSLVKIRQAGDVNDFLPDKATLLADISAARKLKAIEKPVLILRIYGEQDPYIAFQCCEAIAAATTTDSDAAAAAVKGDAAESLTRAMRVQGIRNATVASACLPAIVNIAAGSAAAAIKDSLFAMGASQLLVNVLRAHGPGNTNVTEASCKAISIISSSNEAYIDSFIALGVSELLVDALRMHGRTHPNVALACCSTVSMIASNNASRANKLVAAGVSWSLADILRVHGPKYPSVASSTSTAIANVATDNATNKARFVSLGVPALLIDVIRSHGVGNAAVSDAFCRAISSIAYDYDVGKTTVVAAGASAFLVDILRSHGLRDASMAWVSCSAIFAVANDHPANVNSLVAAGAPELLLGALRAHALDSAPAVAVCTRAVYTIARNNVSNVDRFVAANASEVMVGLLKVHGLSSAPVAFVVSLVMNLIASNASNVERLVAAGAAWSLVDALRAHGVGSANMARVFFQTIANIAAVTDTELLAAGGIDVLLDAFEVHGRNNASVAATGCNAIANMSPRLLLDLNNFDKFIAAGKLIVDFLQIHLGDSLVAFACSRAVGRFAWTAEGAPRALVSALQIHGTEISCVAEAACESIAVIAQFDPPDGAKSFASTRVFAALLDVLKRYGKDASSTGSTGALKQCLAAVEQLSAYDVGNKAKFNKLNATGVIEWDITVLELGGDGSVTISDYKRDALSALR